MWHLSQAQTYKGSWDIMGEKLLLVTSFEPTTVWPRERRMLIKIYDGYWDWTRDTHVLEATVTNVKPATQQVNEAS